MEYCATAAEESASACSPLALLSPPLRPPRMIAFAVASLMASADSRRVLTLLAVSTSRPRRPFASAKQVTPLSRSLSSALDSS